MRTRDRRSRSVFSVSNLNGWEEDFQLLSISQCASRNTTLDARNMDEV